MHCRPRGIVSTKATLYIAVISLAGMTALKIGLEPWKSDDAFRFVSYLLISIAASGSKVNLPGITRVKILVDGKQRETLAGHADLSGFFEVSAVNQMVAQMQGAQ